MITTNRNLFLGVHVTKVVKTALKKRAKERKVSVSFLVYEILKHHFFERQDGL